MYFITSCKFLSKYIFMMCETVSATSSHLLLCSYYFGREVGFKDFCTINSRIKPNKVLDRVLFRGGGFFYKEGLSNSDGCVMTSRAI